MGSRRQCCNTPNWAGGTYPRSCLGNTTRQLRRSRNRRVHRQYHCSCHQRRDNCRWHTEPQGSSRAQPVAHGVSPSPQHRPSSLIWPEPQVQKPMPVPALQVQPVRQQVLVPQELPSFARQQKSNTAKSSAVPQPRFSLYLSQRLRYPVSASCMLSPRKYATVSFVACFRTVVLFNPLVSSSAKTSINCCVCWMRSSAVTDAFATPFNTQPNSCLPGSRSLSQPSGCTPAERSSCTKRWRRSRC